MTPLRQRMLNDMQLRGLSPKTQAVYVFAVQQFATHYGKSPDLIDEEELRNYFLYLINDKRVSPHHRLHRSLRHQVLLCPFPAAPLAHL